MLFSSVSHRLLSNTDLQPPSTTAKLHDLLQVLDITSTKLTRGTLMLTNQELLYNTEMEKKSGCVQHKIRQTTYGDAG